jgi:hypothetical protein
MSPNELKAKFRRILMGAAAPMVLASCGGGGGPFGCHPPAPMRVTFSNGFPDGGLAQACDRSCGTTDCTDVTADAGGVATVECPVPLCVGRHPNGTLETNLGALDGVGGHLARMAHFEAASVAAFFQIAQELQSQGAPAALISMAKQAARDEIRHATAVGALARKRGVVPPAPKLKAAPPRGVLALALDNAREGCVREAFGALVGLYQAEHATETDVRETMQRVAQDEVAHAAFSFELARHLDEQLSADARAQVAAAREEALGVLLHQALEFQDLPWRDALGLPGADALFELARGFHQAFA